MTATDPEAAEDTASTSDLRIYARLFGYVVPFLGAFIVSVIGYFLYSVSNVGFVQLLAYIVDSIDGKDPLVGSSVAPLFVSIFGEDDRLNRVVIPIAMIAIVVARGVGAFIGNYFITYVSTNVVHRLRCELFEQILALPSRFFDQSTMGHLVAKVTFHVNQVTGAATDAVRVIIREGSTVIGYLAFLLYLNSKLTLIFFAVAPVIALLVSYAGKRFRRISERIQHSMGDVTQVASEAIQGFREVRTFGGAAYERDRFNRVSQNNRRQTMKMVVTSSVSTPIIQLLVALALAALVYLVLDPVILADMTAGKVIAFITTAGLLAKPIRQLSEINSTVQRGLAAAEDIFALFDEDLELDDGRQELETVSGSIEFQDISFRYFDEGPLVLKNVSFRVGAGETIAIVGRSGSGKTTLASLIPRFYTPSDGSILIDETPVDWLTLANLRSHIAVVPQDITLFNDTVSRNIAYGALQTATADEIRAAAARAYALDFIEALPAGMNTIVGDDGVLLSGGQRQRLAIARAFLKDAPILILDEATSSLDSESERFIQAALEAVSRGRTTFVIAHRMSTIESADRIVVLEGGEIVEQGNHQELIALGGLYASLDVGHESDEQPPPEPEQLLAVPRIDAWQQAGFLTRAWYSDARWPRLLRPIAAVYQWLTRLRRRRHEAGAWHARVPVIVAGNINVGGTGKSPLVMALVTYFQNQGLRPGVVSRGYGGRSATYPVTVDGETDPRVAGDEPVMIATRTGCPVVVDPDRTAAVATLQANHRCDIVIADDGLQHYRLARDVEIAVLDGERGLGNGMCLPAGPLREPASRLDEVDLLVATGGDAKLPFSAFSMSLVPEALVNLGSENRIFLNVWQPGRKVHAVCGIGYPPRFFAQLRNCGLEIVEHPFADHHVFRRRDITFDDDLPVLMTEKDAVRCRELCRQLPHQEYWYLAMTTSLEPAFFAALEARLAGLPQFARGGVEVSTGDASGLVADDNGSEGGAMGADDGETRPADSSHRA